MIYRIKQPIYSTAPPLHRYKSVLQFIVISYHYFVLSILPLEYLEFIYIPADWSTGDRWLKSGIYIYAFAYISVVRRIKFPTVRYGFKIYYSTNRKINGIKEIAIGRPQHMPFKKEKHCWNRRHHSPHTAFSIAQLIIIIVSDCNKENIVKYARCQTSKIYQVPTLMKKKKKNIECFQWLTWTSWRQQRSGSYKNK